jgi:hypothetical protein
MITCPNCNHQNPEGSVQCESCYTALPSTYSCPNCGASVQTDATFCGQCGFNLQRKEATPTIATNPFENNDDYSIEEDLMPTTPINADFEASPWDIEEDLSLEEQQSLFEDESLELGQAEIEELPDSSEETEDIESWISSVQKESALEDNQDEESSELVELEPELEINPQYAIMEAEATELDSLESEEELGLDRPQSETMEFVAAKTDLGEETIESATEETISSNIVIDKATEIQKPQAVLFHVQTGNQIEISFNAEIIRMGKPNSQVPPDIDVSSFPNSEIVSRVHADIKAVEDAYYLEDRGSSNGTYINDSPLQRGKSHRLQDGDRIALGKGDLVTFIFQLG